MYCFSAIVRLRPRQPRQQVLAYDNLPAHFLAERISILDQPLHSCIVLGQLLGDLERDHTRLSRLNLIPSCLAYGQRGLYTCSRIPGVGYVGGTDIVGDDHVVAVLSTGPVDETHAATCARDHTQGARAERFYLGDAEWLIDALSELEV